MFINISEYHDWGGDFSQYLDQTKDFLSGTNDTQLEVLNPEAFCPNQRGPGFSLILSPAYAFLSHNIKSFLVLISIFILALGITLYYFYQTNYAQINNKTISLILALNVLYNYNILKLKMEIIPVFPFMFILYSIFLIFSTKRKSIISFFSSTILIGFLISIKNVGWCLYIAVIFHLFLDLIKNNDRNKLKQLLIFLFLPIITVISIKWIVFGNISFENITWYNSVFSFENLKNTIFHNLQSYLNSIKTYFEQEVWGWANILIRDSVLILFFIGLAKRWCGKIEVTDTFFIIYIGLLLLYPYDKANVRFLSPVIPIILIYVADGIKSVQLKIKKHYLVSIFFTLLLLTNYINVKNIIINSGKPVLGPETKEATETFHFIKYSLDSNLPIAFNKPWVLHYYTDKRSLYIDLEGTIKEIENNLLKHKIRYLLLCSDSRQYELYNDKTFNYVNTNFDYKKVWENKQFVLFEYKNSSKNVYKK